MWKRLTNVAWWLGISVYFGGLITLGGIAAPVIFSTTKTSAMTMTMPRIASPPLPMDKEVGGEIFGAILNQFGKVEIVAFFVMLIGVGGFLRAHWPIRWSAWVILIMWLALGAALQYDALSLRPRLWALRDTVRQEAPAHAAEGYNAVWPARSEFTELHERSEALGRIKIYLLFGMILVSAFRGIADGPAKHQRRSQSDPEAT